MGGLGDLDLEKFARAQIKAFLALVRMDGTGACMGGHGKPF
jgi:hypothetical protein